MKYDNKTCRYIKKIPFNPRRLKKRKIKKLRTEAPQRAVILRVQEPNVYAR